MTRLRFLLVLFFAGAAHSGFAQSTSPSPVRVEVVANDGHKLVLWSKRPAGTPKGEIVLLHGRTWSSLPNFDLQVRGQHLSIMDAFVAKGFAVYALDQRGYGATPRDSSQWITPSRAAGDARDVLTWIGEREKSATPPVLFGYSQGSMTSMLTALRDASGMSALVLYGFPIDLSMARAMAAKLPPDTASLARRRTTVTGAEEDFITPESTPAGVKDAYARAAVSADPIRTDWRNEREFATMDAAALHVPVLLINGERDPYASRANLPAFMAAVSGVDRQWTVLAHADHAAHLERQREFVDAVVSFLERRHGAATMP